MHVLGSVSQSCNELSSQPVCVHAASRSLNKMVLSEYSTLGEGYAIVQTEQGYSAIHVATV